MCNRAGHCRTSIYAPDTRRTLLSLVSVQRLWKSDSAWWSFAALVEALWRTAYLGVAEVVEREMHQVWYGLLRPSKVNSDAVRFGVPQVLDFSALSRMSTTTFHQHPSTNTFSFSNSIHLTHTRLRPAEAYMPRLGWSLFIVRFVTATDAYPSGTTAASCCSDGIMHNNL